MNQKIKKHLKKRFASILRIKDAVNTMRFLYLNGQKKQDFGLRSEESPISMPAHISNPQMYSCMIKHEFRDFLKLSRIPGNLL